MVSVAPKSIRAKGDHFYPDSIDTWDRKKGLVQMLEGSVWIKSLGDGLIVRVYYHHYYWRVEAGAGVSASCCPANGDIMTEATWRKETTSFDWEDCRVAGPGLTEDFAYADQPPRDQVPVGVACQSPSYLPSQSKSRCGLEGTLNCGDM